MGKLQESLAVNVSEVKASRAKRIIEKCENYYKRQIEDMEQDLKELQYKKDDMTDLSPNDANSIINVQNFDEKTFCNKYTSYCEQIKNLKEAISIAKEAEQELLGE